ncbi:MAG: hypothetical protein JSS83_21600 [Cyanobacteria bacterium SZAS LIN-3]|nr:hypothetical protein [Cyanobacteria bacterium SZAS LIN-3]
MSSGQTKPEKDDTGKPAAAPAQTGRAESFFDMAARSLHEFQGDTTNRIVDLIAHQDLARKFSDSINSQLAGQYVEGKALLETRAAQGKTASDLSGLSPAQQTAVRAYQKIHNELPASIPLVDRDALMRSVERSIESKVRTSRPESTPIPEPHPRAVEFHKALDSAPAMTGSSTGRTIPKPHEPEARELKSTRSDGSPAAYQSKPQEQAKPQQEVRQIEADKHISAPKVVANLESVGTVSEAPPARAQARGDTAGAIPFSPLLRDKTLPPEWIQPRLETFSLRPAAVAPIVFERLTAKALPYLPHESETPGRVIEPPAQQKASSERWCNISVRLLGLPGSRPVEVTIVRSGSKRIFPADDPVVQKRMHIVRLILTNQGIPIGRIFDQSLRLLPLRPSAPRQDAAATVRAADSVVRLGPSSGVVSRPLSSAPSESAPSTRPDSTATEKVQGPGQGPAKRFVKPEHERFVEKSVDQSVDKQADRLQPQITDSAGSHSRFEPVSKSGSGTEPESRSKSESEPESELDSELELDPDSGAEDEPGKTPTGSKAEGQQQTRITKTFVVRGSMPDKRYITGGELAFVAIMALAGASRVRPDENAGAHGLGMVRREYIMVEEEEGVVWSEPGYELPPLPGKARVDSTEDADNSEAKETAGGSRPRAESERKILMRPQIMVQAEDDLAEMAGLLFNDSRFGHLIADINRHSTRQKFEAGARVVMLYTRQRLSLPVYQDILRFSSTHLREAGQIKLITVVENSAVDRELLEHGLGQILGLNSPNRDPLGPT